MPASVFVYPIIASFICSPVGTIDSVAKIGYFTETEPITYSGRVYIDHEDIDSISLVRHVECEVNFGGSSPTYRYYYNTTQKEGKIKKIREIRNDMDSLIYVLEQRQDGGSVSNNEVFYYVRTFRKRYSNDHITWKNVCGEINQDVIDTLDNDRSHNRTYPGYFSSFMKKGTFDETVHQYCHYLDSPRKLLNPEKPESQTIDLIHRMAVRNGVYPFNQARRDGPVYKAVVSWAGDLQTQTKTLENENEITEEKLFNTNESFSYEDLAADIDGFNISYPLAETTSVSSRRKQYYSRRNNDSQYRYNRFMVNTVSNYYSKPSDRYTNLQKYFEKMVFDRMALRLEDNGSISEITGWHPIKYHFLGGEQKESEDIDTSSQWPSKEARSKACKVFIKHILKKAGAEEQIPL